MSNDIKKSTYCEEQNSDAALNIGTEIGIIVLAAIAGAAIGILFAPSSGRATRKKIKDLTIKFFEQVNDSLEDSADFVRSAALQTSHSIDNAYSDMQKKTNTLKKNITHNFNDIKNDIKHDVHKVIKKL